MPALVHTSTGTVTSMQLTSRAVQLLNAEQQAVTSVHTGLNIPPPSPFLLCLGTPLLPWRTWFVVFSSFLHLLEEECGGPWPDIISNSLLFGLLGTGGHQQLAKSPVMGMMHTAPFGVFAKSITGHFECQFSTVSTTQRLQDQREEGPALGTRSNGTGCGQPRISLPNPGVR